MQPHPVLSLEREASHIDDPSITLSWQARRAILLAQLKKGLDLPVDYAGGAILTACLPDLRTVVLAHVGFLGAILQ